MAHARTESVLCAGVNARRPFSGRAAGRRISPPHPLDTGVWKSTNYLRKRICRADLGRQGSRSRLHPARIFFTPCQPDGRTVTAPACNDGKSRRGFSSQPAGSPCHPRSTSMREDFIQRVRGWSRLVRNVSGNDQRSEATGCCVSGRCSGPGTSQLARLQDCFHLVIIKADEDINQATVCQYIID
jgi:hypothetical protein